MAAVVRGCAGSANYNPGVSTDPASSGFDPLESGSSGE